LLPIKIEGDTSILKCKELKKRDDDMYEPWGYILRPMSEVVPVMLGKQPEVVMSSVYQK
jgi:hypothetical protein